MTLINTLRPLPLLILCLTLAVVMGGSVSAELSNTDMGSGPINGTLLGGKVYASYLPAEAYDTPWHCNFNTTPGHLIRITIVNPTADILPHIQVVLSDGRKSTNYATNDCGYFETYGYSFVEYSVTVNKDMTITLYPSEDNYHIVYEGGMK